MGDEWWDSQMEAEEEALDSSPEYWQLLKELEYEYRNDHCVAQIMANLRHTKDSHSVIRALVQMVRALVAQKETLLEDYLKLKAIESVQPRLNQEQG